MNVLEIDRLTKVYQGGKLAVNALSLQVKPGDLYGFIGPNGAGKTTTLKSAAGILNFERGEILIGGKSVKSDPVGAKMGLAFLPDEPLLYHYMTGIGFLTFVCDIYQVDKEKREKNIKHFAGVLELENALGDLISTYSHGMKQKLSLIGALVHEPKLLMLDEPFIGLDPKMAFELKRIMAEFCSNGGAILFSSHILDVVEKLCNKVAVIANGELVADGPTDQVRGNQSLEKMFLEMTEK